MKKNLFDVQLTTIGKSEIEFRLIELMEIEERHVFQCRRMEMIEMQTEFTRMFLSYMIETMFVD